jgi:hypothetical protein
MDVVQVDSLTPASNASHTKSGASQATASRSKTTHQSKMASNLDSGALKTFRGNINRANRECSMHRQLMLRGSSASYAVNINISKGKKAGQHGNATHAR